ncbi:sugar ABC transporter permease [uncultured Anaerotruncus sp.]|uniref:carbohydrate ABC transporter permease n=1 Tax=uncultured Anaerotruncus sp. TaxID=905011 RepID=UPI00280C196A|nr:sugar ABC transporter permease [uncultured Anaerotruncus sp.]
MMHSLKRLGKFLNKPNRSAYFFIFPAAIILIVFTFVPLIGTLAFGFLNVNLFFSEITFAGFDNFIRFFNDTRAINSLLHSLGFMLWQVPLQISVGLLLAVALQKNNWFNKMCRSICFVPVVCSLTAISIIWTVLLNRNVGYIPHLIRQLGLQAPAFLTDAKWALPTVAIATVWKDFGMTLVILTAALQDVSPSLYESAEIDGAGPVKKFFWITIPQIIPSIGFCLLTTFISSMQVFDQVFIMTGGGPLFQTESAVLYIYKRGFSPPFELGYASAVSWMLFVMIAVIAFSMNRYMARKEEQCS